MWLSGPGGLAGALWEQLYCGHEDFLHRRRQEQENLKLFSCPWA
jgi:hypothetical protein